MRGHIKCIKFSCQKSFQQMSLWQQLSGTKLEVETEGSLTDDLRSLKKLFFFNDKLLLFLNFYDSCHE